MQINFFAEPTKNCSLQDIIQKASLIDFPGSTIYLATRSYAEFLFYKRDLWVANQKVEAGYWAILEKSYWPSPFSYPWELKKLRRELEERSPKELLKVLVDLESPMLNKKLFLFNLSNLWQNKKEIKNLLNDAESLNI